MRRRYLCLLWLFCASLSWGASFNSPLNLTYTLRREGLTLFEVDDTVVFDDHKFEIKSNGHGAGILALIPRVKLIRSSDGIISTDGLQPLHYTEERGNKERVLTADFDWSSRHLNLGDNGEKKQIDLPSGTLDRLSFPYSFYFLPNPPDHFKIDITDGRSVTEYQFQLVGKDTINTGIGRQLTLHYSRQRSGKDPEFDLWLGLDQHLLPLRVLFTDRDGAHFEQVVGRIEHGS